MVVFWSRSRIKLSQRCHNNASDVLPTTKNYCSNVVFSTSVFRPDINVAATSWSWCCFPDEILKVFQYHYNFLFPKIHNIALQFHFLIKKIILDVSMERVCSNGGYLKIFSLLPDQSSLTRNSSLFSGGKFGKVVV